MEKSEQSVNNGDDGLGLKENNPITPNEPVKRKHRNKKRIALMILLVAVFLIIGVIFTVLFLLARAGRSSLIPVYTPPKDQVIRRQSDEATPEQVDLENGAQRSQPIPSTGGR